MVSSDFFPWHWNTNYLFAFGDGTVIATAAAAFTMNLTMRHLPSVITATRVLAAPLIRVSFMSEALTLTLAAGDLQIIAGIVLVTLNPSRT